MDQTQALTKLRKLLGANFGYRVNAKALNAKGRADAQARAIELRAKKLEAEAALSARRDELLKDPTYQALRDEYDAVNVELDNSLHAARTKRITVGVTSDLFFTIKAEGDNWDEVVGLVANNR